MSQVPVELWVLIAKFAAGDATSLLSLSNLNKANKQASTKMLENYLNYFEPADTSSNATPISQPATPEAAFISQAVMAQTIFCKNVFISRSAHAKLIEQILQRGKGGSTRKNSKGPTSSPFNLSKLLSSEVSSKQMFDLLAPEPSREKPFPAQKTVLFAANSAHPRTSTAFLGFFNFWHDCLEASDYLPITIESTKPAFKFSAKLDKTHPTTPNQLIEYHLLLRDSAHVRGVEKITEIVAAEADSHVYFLDKRDPKAIDAFLAQHQQISKSKRPSLVVVGFDLSKRPKYADLTSFQTHYHQATTRTPASTTTKPNNSNGTFSSFSTTSQSGKKEGQKQFTKFSKSQVMQRIAHLPSVVAYIDLNVPKVNGKPYQVKMMRSLRLALKLVLAMQENVDLNDFIEADLSHCKSFA